MVSSDDESSGWSDFEDRPHASSPPRGNKNKSKEPKKTKKSSLHDEDISNAPKNVLQVGAGYEDVKNAGTKLQADFIRAAAQVTGTLGQRKSSHLTASSSAGKNGFVLQCVTDPRGIAREKATCSFFLRAVSVTLGDARLVKIKNCCLDHSAGCRWASGVMERQRGTNSKFIERATGSKMLPEDVSNAAALIPLLSLSVKGTATTTAAVGRVVPVAASVAITAAAGRSSSVVWIGNNCMTP